MTVQMQNGPTKELAINIRRVPPKFNNYSGEKDGKTKYSN